MGNACLSSFEDGKGYLENSIDFRSSMLVKAVSLSVSVVS